MVWGVCTGVTHSCPLSRGESVVGASRSGAWQELGTPAPSQEGKVWAGRVGKGVGKSSLLLPDHSCFKHSVGLILAALNVCNPIVTHAISKASNAEPAKNHHSRSMRYTNPSSHFLVM